MIDIQSTEIKLELRFGSFPSPRFHRFPIRLWLVLGLALCLTAQQGLNM